jgi:hypothetical protein
MAVDDRSRQWGRLGSEWLGLAQRTSDPKARASLLAVSYGCLDLAERSERDTRDQLLLRHRAIQADIARGLQDFYPLPSDVPHRLLTLLVQMNATAAKQDGNGAHGAGGP